jgi:hypothetical protein
MCVFRRECVEFFKFKICNKWPILAEEWEHTPSTMMPNKRTPTRRRKEDEWHIVK